MENPMEIIATFKDDSSSRIVEFSELHGLIDNISSVMFLWNTNCYYVDSVSKTFIVNGGRRTRFNEMGNCKILYRRRNQLRLSMSGVPGETRSVWILGLVSEYGEMVLLSISEDGSEWGWATKL